MKAQQIVQRNEEILVDLPPLGSEERNILVSIVDLEIEFKVAPSIALADSLYAHWEEYYLAYSARSKFKDVISKRINELRTFLDSGDLPTLMPSIKLVDHHTDRNVKKQVLVVQAG